MTHFSGKSHWEEVYSTRSPMDVSWYQPTPSVSLALIDATGLGPEARIVDVGGGAATLVDALLDRHHTQISVLDISATALEHAKRRLSDRARLVEWIEEDVLSFQPRHAYDIWHDRAVFHFMTKPDDQLRYVSSVERSLQPGGHVIVGAFALDGPDKCSGLEVVRYDEVSLAAHFTGFNLVEARSERHVTPAGKEQSFIFCRLVKS